MTARRRLVRRALAGAVVLLALAVIVAACNDALTRHVACHVIGEQLVANEECWYSGRDEICRVSSEAQPVYACAVITPTARVRP